MWKVLICDFHSDRSLHIDHLWMQSIFSTYKWTDSKLSIELLNQSLKPIYIIRLWFIHQENVCLITDLSMHAHLAATSALCFYLKALFSDLGAHQVLVVDEPLLHTFDYLFPLKLISQVLLKDSLPVAFPVDIEHYCLPYHILVYHTDHGRKIFIVGWQLIFQNIFTV